MDIHYVQNIRLNNFFKVKFVKISHREHEELVDAYTLELLTVFVDSLSMTHQDEPSIGMSLLYSIADSMHWYKRKASVLRPLEKLPVRWFFILLSTYRVLTFSKIELLFSWHPQ